MNVSKASTRFALKKIFGGFTAILIFAAILSTTGCVGVTSKGAAQRLALTLSLSPTSITFGNITVGQTSTKSVTLTNSGTGILMISGISVSGSEFTASGPHLPLALSAGQSSSISVVFKPTADTPATGTITISQRCGRTYNDRGSGRRRRHNRGAKCITHIDCFRKRCRRQRSHQNRSTLQLRQRDDISDCLSRVQASAFLA